MKHMLKRYKYRLLTKTSVANLDIPIYELDYHGRKLAVFNAYVGAAGCVAVLEDLVAMGMKKLILFGTCGILEEQVKETSIIVPTIAVRDEGTSFHYSKICKKRGRCDTISCSKRYVPSRILCWNGKESTGINAGIAYG